MLNREATRLRSPLQGGVSGFPTVLTHVLKQGSPDMSCVLMITYGEKDHRDELASCSAPWPNLLLQRQKPERDCVLNTQVCSAQKILTRLVRLLRNSSYVHLENGVVLAGIFGIVAFQQTSAGCIS